MTPNPQVQKILDNRLSSIPGVQHAVVVSADGMALYWSGCDKERAERDAALTSSLGALAIRVSDERGAGTVSRTLIEMEQGCSIIARAGVRSYVRLDIRRDTDRRGIDMGTVGRELALMTQELSPVLDAEERTPSGAHG